MANLLQKTIQRSTWPTITLDQWTSFFEFGGLSYPFSSMFSQTMGGHAEVVDSSFEGLVLAAYKTNGVVFACMLARQLVFSEARFQFRQRNHGRPGELFGNNDLAILERPWPGGVTADLLSRAIQDVDLAGNFFAARRGIGVKSRIRRLRPDWVTIVLGSFDDPTIEAGDLDAEVVGYIYHPGGRQSSREPVFLLREQVAHFAPIPDPIASYRGMSWLLPVIREFASDSAMMIHKQKFFENGATPNMIVTLDPSIKKDAFKEWVQMFSEKHEGALNAYKTLYLGAGSNVQVVGKDFQQMEFAVTQAGGETRIAAAAGVPPVIVGLSEGIKAATYSNYSQARRRFADMTIRPLWRSIATSLEVLVPAPGGAELWYDDRDIPFLIEDFKDRAEVQRSNAASIRQLIDGGFIPESVIAAVTANDLSLLKHSGLLSVQLQPPGQPKATTPTTPSPTPPKPTTKSDDKDGYALLRDFIDRSPAPPPRVEVNFHEGAFRNESPVTVDAPTTFQDGAIRAEPHVQIDAPTTIEDGAVRVESPVTVEAPTTFADGAFRIEPEINVDAPTTIAEGAVRVDAPVTVEPGNTEVVIADGAMRLELVDGAIRVSTPVTIEEGAVQVSAPVTVERSDVHVDPGAVQVSAPVTVERTEVHVDPGAVHVPVTVERTEVHVDPGAVQIDSPVTVERTEVHLDPGSVTVPVTVSPETRFDEGAIKVDARTTIEEGAVRVDAPVTIEPAEVRVEAPITVEPTQVTIAEGAVRVDAPTTISEGAVRVDSPVTIEPGAVEVRVDAPVHIEEGAVKVDSPVTVERGAVEVQVDGPEVNVPPPPERPRRRTTRKTEFRTNDDGVIVGKDEVETEDVED